MARYDAGGTAPGAADKVKASATDTTPNYLLQKLTAGVGIALTLLNSGANESVQVALSAVDLTQTYITSGPANTFLKGTGAGNVWATLFASPANPGDNGKVTLASAGDFVYVGGSSAGQALIWSGAAWAASNDFVARDLTTTGTIAIGASPHSATGDIRGSSAFTLNVRNVANSADLGILAMASNSLTVGNNTGNTTVKGSAQVILTPNSVNAIVLSSTTLDLFAAGTTSIVQFGISNVPTFQQTIRSAAGTAAAWALTAQGTSANAGVGGALNLTAGSSTNVTAGSGGTVVAAGGNSTAGIAGDATLLSGTGVNTQSHGRVTLSRAGQLMLEITGKLGAAQRVLSLVRTVAVTAVELPANTGDLVIYIGNAAANPSADAVSGHIYYSDGAKPAWRFNATNFRFNGTATTASAGAGAALPLTVEGYMDVQINGTQRKIPYYAA